MFGSTVLDVVTGLVFVFLAVSLAASALTEALASLLKLRHRTLLSGIEALLNDTSTTGLVKDLYNHALVNPLAPGNAEKQAVWTSWTTKPAYIESSNFAQVLVSTLEKPLALTKEEQDAGKVAVKKTIPQMLVDISNDQLKQALQELYTKASQDRDEFLIEVARWFDDAMDRVGGWYKRYTQVIGFLMAFMVATVLNADAIRIGETLWQRPTLVAELSVDNALPAPGSNATPVQAQVPTAQKAVDELKQANLLGRSTGTPTPPFDTISMVLGWLIVAGASLFGAPFWFDLLQRIGQVAGVGPSADAARTRAGKPVP